MSWRLKRRHFKAMLISVGLRLKFNKSRRLLSYLWPILKCMKIWVSSLQRVSSCMDNPVPEKLFLLRLLPVKLLPLSWESSDQNLFKSTWVMDPNSSENSLKPLKKIHPPSSSSMKSMPSVPRDTILIPEAKKKFKELCSNFSINWTVSTLTPKSKSSWPPTK